MKHCGNIKSKGDAKGLPHLTNCDELYCHDHSHQSSRDDRSRNEQWGTGNGTWDLFLHCRNENVPMFPSRKPEQCSWNVEPRGIPVPRLIWSCSDY